MRRRDVFPRSRRLPLQVHLQHSRFVHTAAVHLTLVLWTAVEQDPRGVQRISVADDCDGLAWMLAGQPPHHGKDSTAHRFDRLVARNDSTPHLMDEPERTPHGD